MLDLLYLTQSGDTLPSVRFRVLPMIAKARAAGLAASHVRVPKTLAGRLFFYWFLPKSRVTVVQKRLLSPRELSLVRRRTHLLAFDFDDALWTSHPNVPPSAERDARQARDLVRLETVCRSVDLVVAGNATLAAKVRPWARRVEVLPTPLDTGIYVPDPGERSVENEKITGGPKIIVGWMGTSCNLYFLPEVLESLRPLTDRVMPVVVSDGKCTLVQELGGICEAWTPDNELPWLQRMDVGLMPLTDDDYTRGKCGFKLLQYMACGAVPVASPVGMNTDIIRDGENGLLADSPEAFAQAVHRLADNPALREVLAAEARRTVVARYSLDAAWESLRGILGL